MERNRWEIRYYWVFHMSQAHQSVGHNWVSFIFVYAWLRSTLIPCWFLSKRLIFTLIIIKQNNSLKSLLIHFHSHYLMNMDRQKGIKIHQHWIIGITNSMVIYNSVGPMKLNKSFYMLHRKLINTVFRNMSF